MRYLFFPLLAFIVSMPLLTHGQTLEDAVRYSQLEAGGTARSMGIGGGIGALGADFSVLSTNPAGLATFRRSEFSFTPVFNTNSNESQLDGTGFSSSRNKPNFSFNSLGLVFSSKPLSLNWTNTAFGVGFNRLANFHQRAYYDGTTPGSITDRWAELAQGVFPNDLGAEAGLAFDADAIYNPDENDLTSYTSDFLPGEQVGKSQNIRRKGGYNELVLSYAGNFKEKLMIGATVGIPLVNFEETKTYVETVADPTNTVFNELTYVQRQNTSGVGINLKLGMVYRISQMVRLGAAIHTPTGIGLKDSASSSLDYSFNIDGIPSPGSAALPESTFEYRLRTPWRLIGSAGFVFGKRGFLVAEVEYLDYVNAQFNFNNSADGGDPGQEADLNEAIGGQLTSAVNIRLGGEYALDRFRFRGGYAIMQSPYAEGFDATGMLSLGAGAWLGESVFLDAAYRRRSADGQYSPYSLGGLPAQTVSQTDTRSAWF